MIKKFLQILAFLFPRPINVWLHRLAGGKIGKGVSIDPGVLLIAEKVEIADTSRIKFGTIIKIRELKLGEKKFNWIFYFN